MKKFIAWMVLTIVLLGAGLVIGSATYHWNVPPGLTVGDILYADRKGRLTNLNAGSSGEVLQAAGASTAPSYVAKNLFRQAAIHNFATLAVSWTLSADELLCIMLATTNANAACTIQATGTAGKTFILRNGSGQNNTIHSADGTGITVATGKQVTLIYDGIIGDWVKISTEITP